MSGPEQRYEDGIANNELENDDSQREAVRLLQSLYEELCASENKKAGFLDRFLVPKAVAIRGLYFWGGVGRGKTFLMDLFYESLPFEKKRRLHFHRFMREVHLVLQDLQGEVDPIKLKKLEIHLEPINNMGVNFNVEKSIQKENPLSVFIKKKSDSSDTKPFKKPYKLHTLAHKL